MPVLYGILMYMGVNTLHGMQLIDRLALLIIPKKHQPDHTYLRHVPLHKVKSQNISELMFWTYAPIPPGPPVHLHTGCSSGRPLGDQVHTGLPHLPTHGQAHRLTTLQ